MQYSCLDVSSCIVFFGGFLCSLSVFIMNFRPVASSSQQILSCSSLFLDCRLLLRIDKSTSCLGFFLKRTSQRILAWNIKENLKFRQTISIVSASDVDSGTIEVYWLIEWLIDYVYFKIAVSNIFVTVTVIACHVESEIWIILNWDMHYFLPISWFPALLIVDHNPTFRAAVVLLLTVLNFHSC